MFKHNFNYTLKTLFRDKTLIFWTFAFPLILGTFFHMAFSNIEKSEQLDTINIAVVKNEEYNNSILLKQTIAVLSNKKNEEHLFNTQYVTEKQARKLLKDDKIAGYLIPGETPKVVVMTNGINQTIIKQVVEEIIIKEETIKKVTEAKIGKYLAEQTQEDLGNLSPWYATIYQNILKEWGDEFKIQDISDDHLSYTMIEFYTLIAMTCLYGGILGMVALNRNLANMSNKGKRVAVSPCSKLKLILSSTLGAYITQMIGLILLFLYTIFILKVDYGDNLSYIIFLTLAGCLAGLSLGLAIATIFKTSENTKTGIVISVTMLGCFLSGMMGITMKYIVDKNIPLINRLNPAAMITDGFYSLYYYNTLDRFTSNLISLFIFSGIMLTISIISLRRQSYDSI